LSCSWCTAPFVQLLTHACALHAQRPMTSCNCGHSSNISSALANTCRCTVPCLGLRAASLRGTVFALLLLLVEMLHCFVKGLISLPCVSCRRPQVTVLCNDCSHRSQCVFHVVGHKCGQCGGFNTRRVGGDAPAPEAPAAAGQASDSLFSTYSRFFQESAWQSAEPAASGPSSGCTQQHAAHTPRSGATGARTSSLAAESQRKPTCVVHAG
jgi:hypothetical protein